MSSPFFGSPSIIALLLLPFRLCDINGVMSNCSGNEINVQIFLCCILECSNLFKWKLATIGSCLIVNCLVLSWYVWQLLHFIFALDPKCSARVNLSKQSNNEVGGPELSEPDALAPGPKSKDISQNGSIVVDTPLKNYYINTDSSVIQDILHHTVHFDHTCMPDKPHHFEVHR